MPLASGRRKTGRNVTASDTVQTLDLSGKTFFITGANTGIGFETAKALALQGGHVILACRNNAAANDAKDLILKEKANASVDILELDLSKLTSVEECAESFKMNRWPLHCLILNAGLIKPTEKVTEDGFETTFQVNHLAQFYLVQLLLPLLLATSPSRVVVVSSSAHQGSFLQPSDITWQKLSPKQGASNSLQAYNQSKLLNILFANELNSRYEAQGLTSNSIHPGMDKGAATTTYCATAPELEGKGGLYFVNCKPVDRAARARNPETGKQLWELSCEMIQHFKDSKLSKTVHE